MLYGRRTDRNLHLPKNRRPTGPKNEPVFARELCFKVRNLRASKRRTHYNSVILFRELFSDHFLFVRI